MEGIKKYEPKIPAPEQVCPLIGLDGLYENSEGKWVTKKFLTKRFGVTEDGLPKVIQDVRSIRGIDARGIKHDLFSLGEVDAKAAPFLIYPQTNDGLFYVEKISVEGGEQRTKRYASSGYFQKKYGIAFDFLKRRKDKLDIKLVRMRGFSSVDYFEIASTEELIEKWKSLPTVAAQNVFLDGDGEAWVNTKHLIEVYGVAPSKKILSLARTMEGRTGDGVEADLYNLDDLLKAAEGLLIPFTNKDGRYIDGEGRKRIGFDTLRPLLTRRVGRFGLKSALSGVDHIKGKTEGVKVDLYLEEEALKVIEELNKKPEADIEHIYTDEVGKEWVGIAYADDEYGVNSHDFYVETKGLESKEVVSSRGKNKVAIFYPKGEVDRLFKKREDRPTLSQEGILIDASGVTHVSIKYLRKNYNLGDSTIRNAIAGLPFTMVADTSGKEVQVFEEQVVGARLKETKKYERRPVDPEVKLKASLEIEAAEPMPEKMKTLVSLIKEELPRLGAEIPPELNIETYNKHVLSGWAESMDDERKSIFGLKRYRFKGHMVWSYDPDLFLDGSSALESLRDYMRRAVSLARTRFDTAERIPDKWKPFSDWVRSEIVKISPGLDGRMKNFAGFVQQRTNRWIKSVGENQCKKWGVEQRRVRSGKIRWCYDPAVFSEGSDAYILFRAFLVKEIGLTEERAESIKSLPEGWKLLGDLVREEMRKIDPTSTDNLGDSTYVSKLIHSWIEVAPKGSLSTWGVERCRAKTTFAWSYDPSFFQEESEGLASLRGFIKDKMVAKSVKREKQAEAEQQDKLEHELTTFFKNVEEGSTPEAKQFRSLIRALGAARCVDVLFSLHPRFRDLPLEVVNGILGEYLGGTITPGGGGGISDFAALEYLPKLDEMVEERFVNSLVETIKDDCYKYYVAQKRGGSEESAQGILHGYLNNLETELRRLQVSEKGEERGVAKKTLLDHPLVGDAVLKVLTYFQDIWKVELPDRVATYLRDGREFPDLAQRINIKEIQDKRRMLIADEMGMGKSASAILAHEAAREKARNEERILQPALILIPSNVVETWRRYLSSNNAKGGCFKQGEAPRILEIESPTDFAKVEDFDYVLMSQERLNERNQAVLEAKWSSVIVDEVHKLKAAQGVRSSFLRKITQRQGPEDQLILLSGTPIPNTIRDVAVALTLLYPDMFKDIEPAALATRLLQSDLVEVRTLLTPRMQTKSLAESVELPPLEEKVTSFNLSADHLLQYQTFVEESDDMDPLSKIYFLRRWLLDPSLGDMDPGQTEGLKGEKALLLEKRLQTALEEGDTHVVVFVNDMVDGILRPSKRAQGIPALVDRLSLPSDVKRGIIHGETSEAARTEAQRVFQSREGRMVLFVSGNTADVGVDFSAGQRVLSFNEPWTRYAHEQQRSRVYRPGVQNPVTSEILVTLNTIEQGIHEYVERKYHAIEKVLQGIPLTEIEKELLMKDAESDGADASFASEIAEQYLSAWERLMRLFSASGEVGEEDFQRFVERHGKEYAELYKEFRARSFAGNVNRVCGTIVKAFSKTLDRGSTPQVLDAASGPEMLRRALPEDLAKGVTSMDINPHMFKGKTEGPTVVAGWTDMPFPDESFDLISSSLAWVHTSMQPKKNQVDRVKVLEEMQRVLKVGGWVVLALTPARPLKDVEQFRKAVSELGFNIVEGYTGSVRTYDKMFQLPLITLSKRESVEPKEDLVGWTKEVLERYPDAFSFEKSKRRGRHPRKMFGSCVIEATLNGTPTPLPMEIVFKEDDRKIYEEEKAILQVARGLKTVFTEMHLIPPHVLKQHTLSRVRLDNGSYALYTPFKTTESGLLIGETVWKGL